MHNVTMTKKEIDTFPFKEGHPNKWPSYKALTGITTVASIVYLLLHLLKGKGKIKAQIC